MPTKDCNTNKKIAQTLFLGASVANFNVSLGWGSQPSQLSVNLIEDKVSSYCDNYGEPIAASFPPYQNGEIEENHYHDCVDDDCYMLPDGKPFDSEIHDVRQRQTLGKVFYKMYNNPPIVTTKGKSNCVLSNYWYHPDPGFLGLQNRLNIDGSWINIYQQDNSNLNPAYDIINCPVYFKVGDFSFGGVVQSWNRSQSSSGDTISVTIEDMKSVLSNCYMILDKFSGAIYSKLKSVDSYYGGPKNWLGTQLDYTGRLYNGNIPNVFNIYGFLESFSTYNFGGSNKNKNGISVNDIVNALTVLTGNFAAEGNFYQSLNLGAAPKSAFSPFGRILTKTIQSTDTFQNILPSFNSFGVIPPSISLADRVPRNEFVLDLSELPKFPDNFRINDPVISVVDFVSRITEESGYDFTFDLNPVSYNGELFNVIKLKLVSRNKQPRPNQIENTVNQLLCDGYDVSSATYGKEKNNTNLKSVVIGANQKRLLQLKSARLAYTQTNLVFNSQTLEFVNYDTLGNSFFETRRFQHGKYRYPSTFSTNNPGLSKQINPNQSDLYDANEAVSDLVGTNNFDTIDQSYGDNGLTGYVTNNGTCGNYFKSVIINQNDPIESNDPSDLRGYNQEGKIGESFRFFPLFKDVICPFFGYVREEEIKINLGEDKNTDFRKIRPVYLDTWTGQLCVLIELHEFPQISVNLTPTLTFGGKSYIIISESEIRAALVGFDNFLVYSLAKIFRPDLVEALRLSHQNKYYNKLLGEGKTPAEAADMAKKKYDWFWRAAHANIAGPFGQPVEVAPAKNDGSSYIDEKALQDLQILHQFVNQLGSYYGKQYMVSLPNLQSYKDQQYADITLGTSAGDCYVFKGGGDLYYNYQPTDGAWEEPGNVIDDSIAVGGSNYFALAEPDGKMGCLLGYNSNKYFDYTKEEMCKFAQQIYEQNIADMDDQKLNPAWSYQIFDELLKMRDQSCPEGDFVFNNVNLSALPTTDYINISMQDSSGRDAWGKTIPENEPIRKAYIKAQVDPSIKYIEPANLFFPKAIVTSPGLSLNTSSTQYKKDPNRTVIANVSIEDLNLYMKTTAKESWDYEFIAYLLYYVSPTFKGLFQGNYAVNSDESANHVEIAPKAAHPFFAAIPIQFNNMVYGPWSNNVYVDYLRDPQSVFPDGENIKLSDTLPYSCVKTAINISDTSAKNIIDNLIGPISIEIDEELAPWNFGGAGYMDEVANIKAYSKVNYQAIIESAQIQMPGLPLFDLGSDFSVNTFNNRNINVDSLIRVNQHTYTDTKPTDANRYGDPRSDIGMDDYSDIALPNFIMPVSTVLTAPNSTNSVELLFETLSIDTKVATPGTVITNVQVNIGNDGINTTYSLRTYTKKLSLFNKTEIDRVTKQGKEFVQRDKQLASVRQQSNNIELQQFRTREEKRLGETNAYFDSIGFSSKLFGWSPSTVLVGQASPYMQTLEANPDYIPPDSLYVKPSGYGSLSGASNLNLPTSSDTGDDDATKGADLVQSHESHIPTMMNTLKIRSDVGMYEMKEVRAQLSNDYGMQSAMSMDGLLSPISFFPTHKNSTFNFIKYDTTSCPFCHGSKLIKTQYKFYDQDNGIKETRYVFCDKCDFPDNNPLYRLKSTTGSAGSEILPPYIVTNLSDLNLLSQFKNLGTGGTGSSSSSSSGGSAKINLLNLNPILVSNGAMRNQNTQSYEGEHPDGKHGDLNIGAYAGKKRPFYDRCWHSIEIVGRGAVTQQKLTINDANYDYESDHNPNFYNEDLILQKDLNGRNTGAVPVLNMYQMNQRFFGLRGPLTLHGWGYDTEGYPVPNAADEPYEFDTYGRPRRFKIKRKSEKTVPYSNVSDGEAYEYFYTVCVKNCDALPEDEAEPEFEPKRVYGIKGELEPEPPTITSTEVTVIQFENDMNNFGGFPGDETNDDRTTGYQGDIISKTQKWDGSSWSQKIKLNEFYLNFGERPDLWPVGPVDLRWDEERMVWSVPSPSIYKMVYITLEEDMTKPADHYDETFAARGYLDELEYNSEPLPDGSRRLVYVKDKSGWTAPRGAKFLCRYDSDSGFYEPVSKPSYSVFGKIVQNNQANISMHYAQGKSAGSIPTMSVPFENKLNLSYKTGANGFFNYDGGKWTLISVG